MPFTPLLTNRFNHLPRNRLDPYDTIKVGREIAMSTPAQILANRTNAQNSTGPRSPEGKVAVSQNARSHGLTGSFSVLAHEDRAEFDSLLNEYQAEFHPQSAHETFLVEQMAQSRWTLARARRLEAHVLDQLAGAPAADDPDARIAAQIVGHAASPFNTVQRYIRADDRAYFRAHRDLTRAREKTSQNKANADDALFAELLRPVSYIPKTAPPPVDPPAPKPEPLKAASATAACEPLATANPPKAPATWMTSIGARSASA